MFPEAMAEKNRMQIAAYYGGLAITASWYHCARTSAPAGGTIAHEGNHHLLVLVMRFNSEHPAVRERLAAAFTTAAATRKDLCSPWEEKTAWMIARLEHIVTSGYPHQPRRVWRSLGSAIWPTLVAQGTAPAGEFNMRLVNV